MLSALNGGLLPMSSGLSRLQARLLDDEAPGGRAARTPRPVWPRAALDAGLVTFTPDEIDWDDEVRLAVEERAAMSPDALTGMEASLRFAGPETMRDEDLRAAVGLAELDLHATERDRREGRAQGLRKGRATARVRLAAHLKGRTR